MLWRKTRQSSVRIFRNLGFQVGILRRVIRRGASEKVTVEQRLGEGGRADKQITGERLGAGVCGASEAGKRQCGGNKSREAGGRGR